MAVDLSVLVVSYNTRAITLECLRAVQQRTRDVNFELIVLDNASADGSADAVERIPDVRLIRQQSNLGFARGNNIAARGSRGEWLLLLNPDTVVTEGAIRKLVEFAQRNPEGSIFGGRTIFADGSLNPASCWGRPTPWSLVCFATGLARLFRGMALFNPEGYGGWGRDSVRCVDIVSGCFFLIRKATWDQLGGFDEAFFMYGEEADFCLRAAKLGHRCIICPDAVIVHHGGASEPLRADKIIRLFAAKERLIVKHWSPVAAIFGRWLLRAWALTRSILSFVLPQMEQWQTWRKVWERRSEWMYGYEEQHHGHVATTG